MKQTFNLQKIGYGTRLRPERPRSLRTLRNRFQRAEEAEQAEARIGFLLVTEWHRAAPEDREAIHARFQESDRRWLALIDKRNEAWDRLRAAALAHECAIECNVDGERVGLPGSVKYRLQRSRGARWTRGRLAASHRRTAPRRLGARRHRRATTRRAAAAGDDSGSPEPPPRKLAVIVPCAGLAAGFAFGALAATVLP